MKQAILYIAAFLGNKVNYSYSYPEHIKNKFYNNQLSQLKMVMLLLSFLALYYSYLGVTQKEKIQLMMVYKFTKTMN